MKDDNLDALFERARGARLSPTAPLPTGFADRMVTRYQFELYREKTAARASVLSISAALVIFAVILTLNLNATTSLGADDQDPVDYVAQVVWDSAGN
jgi:hypothetical protein